MKSYKPIIHLKPTIAPVEELESLEREIKRAFREELYAPIMKALNISPSMIMNASSFVVDALRKGTIRYRSGSFYGSFSAGISRELKKLGASWDPKSKSWQISKTDLPGHIKTAIAVGEQNFKKLQSELEATLAKILPEKITGLIDSVKAFDNLLAKSEKDFQASIKNITIAPKLSVEAKARIAADWGKNLDLYIKGFLDSEIIELRKAVQKSILAGNRYESLVDSIRRSYGVTERKARFLARQETNLLLTKYQETRYTAAGVMHYEWRCVVGSPDHPVRPSHKILDGKIFRWDDPPITTEKGQPVRRNNPGQDYNCRCKAIPVLLK